MVEGTTARVVVGCSRDGAAVTTRVRSWWLLIDMATMTPALRPLEPCLLTVDPRNRPSPPAVFASSAASGSYPFPSRPLTVCVGEPRGAGVSPLLHGLFALSCVESLGGPGTGDDDEKPFL